MTEREVLRLALDWIEGNGKYEDGDKIATAIKEVLAQPEQEPVAWITQGGKGWLRWHKSYDDNKGNVPLYTTPPQRKPLTDEMGKRMKENYTSMEMQGAFADGWLSAEAAHGINYQK